MGYPFSWESLPGTTMPRPEHQSGDWMIAFYSQQNGSVVTPTGSGWTELASTANINSHIGKIYAKKATSSSETIPNAEGSAGINQLCSVIILRGLHASSIVAASQTETDAGVAYTAPAVTPTADNQLVMHFNLGGVSGRHIMPLHGVVELIDKTNSQNHHSVCFRYGGASGVAISEHPYVTNTDTANKFSQWIFTIAFVDDGNEYRSGVPDISNPPAEMLHFLGLVGRSGHLNGAALSFDPTSYIPSVTNDETSYNDTAIYDAIDSTSVAIVKPGYAFSSIENTSTTNDILIAGTDLEVSGGNKDFSGEILAITFAGLPRTSTNSIGSIFGITDKTNTRIWQLDGANNYPNGSITNLTATIEVDGGFEIDDIGTVNTASISAIVVGGEVTPGSTGELTFAALNRLDTIVMKHGTITTDMRHVELVSRTAMLNTVKNQFGQTDTQYTVAQSIRIETQSWGGDLKQAIAYPQAYNYTGKKTLNKLSAGLLSFELNPPSGGTHDVSGWLFVMGNYHGWGVTSGAAGTVICTGAYVTGCTPILNDSAAPIGGFTIDSSKEVTYTTLADMSVGGTFSNCVDAQQITLTGATQAALQSEVDKIANNKYQTCAVAIRIEYTGTGDISLNFNNVKWTGNTTDIHYDSTNASQLTAVMANGSNASQAKVAVSGTATGVTVDNPPLALTITDLLAGSDVVILAAGTDTVLDSADQIAGTTFSYVYTVPHSIDIGIIKPGYVTRYTYNYPLGATSASLPLKQTIDRNYA